MYSVLTGDPEGRQGSQKRIMYCPNKVDKEQQQMYESVLMIDIILRALFGRLRLLVKKWHL